LPWEDVARLGQEAGRLAAQMQRPVTLDEAVGHRLRSARAAAAHAKPAGEQPPPAASCSVGWAAKTARPLADRCASSVQSCPSMTQRTAETGPGPADASSGTGS